MALRAHLKDAFDSTWRVLEQVVEDCPDTALVWRGEGASIGSIASVHAHVVVACDVMLHRFLLEESTLMERGGARLSARRAVPVSPLQDEEWLGIEDFDPVALKTYSVAVRDAVRAFLDEREEAALAEEVSTPVGAMPLATYLYRFLIWHVALHSGEIAALKGMQGVRGLPF